MGTTILVDRRGLRYYRQRRGLTQVQLAERVRANGGRCSGDFIGKLERGDRRFLGVANYAAVVAVLNIDYDELRIDLVTA